MKVEAILEIAAARLSVVHQETPFIDVARLFGSGAFRLCVVCDDAGHTVGVVTRTDALKRVANSVDPLSSPIAEMMTSLVISARGSDDLFTTWQMMLERGLHHVPVIDAHNRAIGVLTVDDVLKSLLESEQYEERLLSNYVAGVGYR